MKKEIRHTWQFDNAPEIVWEYLTKPELMAQWLMKNDFKPEVGHKFNFTTNPMPALDFDGKIYCEVLEVSPHTKLTYTWRGGPGDGTTNLDSIVMWTLSPAENGTELNLVHSGFDAALNPMMFHAMNKGWDDNVNKKIRNLINTNAHDATHK